MEKLLLDLNERFPYWEWEEDNSFELGAIEGSYCVSFEDKESAQLNALIYKRADSYRPYKVNLYSFTSPSRLLYSKCCRYKEVLPFIADVLIKEARNFSRALDLITARLILKGLKHE